jgi:hypothetical protein
MIEYKLETVIYAFVHVKSVACDLVHAIYNDICFSKLQI